MKRPGVVWGYSLVVTAGILWWLVSAFPLLSSPVALDKLVVLVGLVAIVPMVGFIWKFFMLKKAALTWMYVAFAVEVAINLLLRQWVWAIVIALFGVAVWDYIRKKKVDGQPLFT